MTDETMKTFEKIPHVTSAYPDLNLNVIMRQGAYEGNVQLHGIPLGAMKNIKLGEGSLPTTETKDMEMVVGNMVAQNFSNAKTGKGYWDTGRCRTSILSTNRCLRSLTRMRTISPREIPAARMAARSSGAKEIYDENGWNGSGWTGRLE